MQGLPSPQEQDELLQGILRKIPALHDPDHLEELVVLALGLVLQRPEDHAKKETLVKSVHASIEAVRRETVPSRFFSAMKSAARHCAALLQTARSDRPHPGMARQPPPPTAVGKKPVPAKRPPGAAPATPRSVIALTIFLVVASTAAMIAIATHAIWRDSPYARRPDILTAAQFAGQLADAASGRPPRSDAGIKLHLMRGADERTILLVEAVPRRICPASGWILARKGQLTINGAAPAILSKAAITALCYRSKDDPSITWSPDPS